MSQPTLKCTVKDLERILQRDYEPANRQLAKLMLDQYIRSEGSHEPIRVAIDCLKMAIGNIEELKNAIALAMIDYRDVISNAEYPNISRHRPAGKFSSETAQGIMKKDWEQLMEWFNKE
jgi:hypothetical protein